MSAGLASIYGEMWAIVADGCPRPLLNVWKEWLALNGIATAVGADGQDLSLWVQLENQKKALALIKDKRR